MRDCAASEAVPGTRARSLFAAGRGVAAAMAVGLMLGACAQDSTFSGIGETASIAPKTASAEAAASPQSELQKATEYWGKQHRESPRDLNAALSYARNLKAMGQKGDALQVLQSAAVYHANDRQLASEYGRLALDLGQVNVAQQVLAAAEDPASPDWRVISARGTVLAKQGKYSEAIPFYERALALSKEQPSVLNNLALAYTLSGEAQKAEDLLRRASAQNSQHASRIRQNLVLVLGVQGRHNEAKQTAMAEGDGDAVANATLLAEIVKAPAEQAQRAPGTATAAIAPGVEPGTAVGGWATRVAAPKPAR